MTVEQDLDTLSNSLDHLHSDELIAIAGRLAGDIMGLSQEVQLKGYQLIVVVLLKAIRKMETASARREPNLPTVGEIQLGLCSNPRTKVVRRSPEFKDRSLKYNPFENLDKLVKTKK